MSTGRVSDKPVNENDPKAKLVEDEDDEECLD